MQEKKRVLFGNAPPRPREGLRWGRLPVQSSPKPSPASPVSRSPRMRPLLARRRKITVRRPCSAVGPEQKQLTAQGGPHTAHPPPRGTPPPLRKKPLTLIRALAAGPVSAGPVPARTGPARASACFRSPPSPPPPGQSWALRGDPIAPSLGGTPGPPCCKPCTTRLGCARRRSCGPERISAPYLAHRGRPPPQEVGGPTPGGVAASGQPSHWCEQAQRRLKDHPPERERERGSQASLLGSCCAFDSLRLGEQQRAFAVARWVGGPGT